MNHPYKPMPQALRQRSGCKVSWRVYTTQAEAEAAAAIARHNARIDEGRGFDFGFMSPGDITQVADGFEVCCP